MGNLIGMVVDMNTNHPTELVDALYREIFDGYPEDAEVDVLLVGRDNPNDEHDSVYTVADVRVLRVDDDVIVSGGGDDERKFQYAKAIWDAFSAAREEDPTLDAFWVMHKHPEGMDFPSRKDLQLSGVLTALDFAYGGSDYHLYCGLGVLNRESGTPVGPDIRPTGDFETDLAVEERMWNRIVEDMDRTDERWARLEAVHAKFIDITTRSGRLHLEGDRMGALRIREEWTQEDDDELHNLMDELSPEPIRRGGGNPLDTAAGLDMSALAEGLPEALQKAISEIFGIDMSTLDATVMPGSTPKVGGVVINMAGILPLGGPGKPPQLGSGDAKKNTTDAIARAFGFQPPEEAVAETEPEPETPEGRPDVPDAFGDLDIRWLD